MKRKQARILAWLCVLAMTVGTLPAVAAEGEDTAAGTQTEASSLASGRDGIYYTYFMQYRDRADAAEALTFDITAAEGAEEYLSVPAVRLTAGGELQWSLRVPADGNYQLSLTYCAEPDGQQNPEISFLLDGTLPFDEAEQLSLARLWKNGEARQDTNGNDLIPKQIELSDWQTVRLRDNDGFNAAPFSLFLTAGEHTLTLRGVTETVWVSALSLEPPVKVRSDAEVGADYVAAGYAPVADFVLRWQAEDTSYKNDRTLSPMYDRTSASAEPYHVSKIRRNVLGKGYWNKMGQTVTYEVTVEKAGLYYMTLKYKQNEQSGVTTYRNVYVNGEIPSASYENIAFPYGMSWEKLSVTGEDGMLCPMYLHEGINTITLEATVGNYGSVLQAVDDISYQLNNLYVQMVMVCGSSPDIYFDYNLDKQIPTLIETLDSAASGLEQEADRYDALVGGKSSQTASLRRAVTQLRDMMKNPDSIPNRLSNFRDTVSTLSSWVYTNAEQSLTLDWIALHSAEAELPSAGAGFWAELWHVIGSFLASYVEDYNAVGASDDSKEAITVWASVGRDQVQVIRDLVTDDFTYKTGIPVNLSLVQTGFIEATLAGAGPDVAIGVARGQPVNLACRNALTDLSQFDTYEEVASRFSETAMVPYVYDGGVYAIPNTQSFFMMFYREDILNSLNLQLPTTWEEVYALIARLQKYNMTFGLPYSTISAAAAVDTGMGAKDMFSILLLQNGGSYYNAAGTAVGFDNEGGLSAFSEWCDYYVQYGFDLVYDFYTRFRYGEMPIGIANYEMYYTLTSAAPEIRGLWKMTTVPGTVREDGTVDTTVGGAGSGIVMFRTDESKQQSCWDFIDWWTTASVQTQYAQNVENILGVAGRHSTANLEAFDRLPWTEEERQVLSEQRSHVQEIQEVPGSYFVSRCLDNAFRAVLYDNENSREMLEKEIRNINREIERKRKQLGLSADGTN